MRSKEARRCGQSTVEQAIVIAFTVVALVAGATYLYRATAGGVKANADSLGTQFDPNAAWVGKSGSATTDEVATTKTTQYSNLDQTLKASP